MWVVNFKTNDKKESSHSFKDETEADKFYGWVISRNDVIEHKIIRPNR